MTNNHFEMCKVLYDIFSMMENFRNKSVLWILIEFPSSTFVRLARNTELRAENTHFSSYVDASSIVSNCLRNWNTYFPK